MFKAANRIIFNKLQLLPIIFLSILQTLAQGSPPVLAVFNNLGSLKPTANSSLNLPRLPNKPPQPLPWK
jgi:hypothetical protein